MKPASDLESPESSPGTPPNIHVGKQKTCPTRLLDDTPADDDLLSFHGDIGPHKRVAQAIAEIIRTPDEAGGKMIGLEGGWGAGKTTVINLLRKELLRNREISIFSFDAWAHEGDPLRRTYLESLIRHFQSVGWVDKDEWNNTLEKLARRRRVTSTRTVPKITTLGKLFGISVLLVPVGSQFLATSLREPITIDPGGSIAWMFIFGLLLTFAPFLVLIGNLIRVSSGRLRKANRKIPIEHTQGDDEEVSDWAFLAANAITETKQDTVETPEPTSIEFEDDFRRLMRNALPRDSNKQAVIVLDNLDRVDPKDALSIWATLQTFLQNQSTQKDQWLNKLWIVVPYDPSGLRRLWENRRATDNEESEKSDTHLQRSTGPQRIVSDSFLDKSFQLRFEVSPPVLSNWKAYLTRLVEQALPEHSPEDRHTIYHVFDLCRAKDGAVPTPRELKLYVNQIGVIHRQWQHEFPLSHVAYYVILRRNHENICEGLRARKLPEMNVEPILPPKLADSLAGLAFNVPANLGQQLLLSDPIYTALTKNDSERLRDLSQLHGEGFWAVLEEVATSQIVGANATTVANAAACLDESGLLEDRKRNETGTVVRAFAQAAANVKAWTPFGEGLATGIAAACRVVSNVNISKMIVESVRETIEEKDKESVHPVSEDIIKSLIIIFKEIDRLGHNAAVQTPIILPVNAEEWMRTCRHLEKEESRWWSLVKPYAKLNEIYELLCSAVKAGQFSEETLSVVAVTQASATNPDWNAFSDALEQRLNASQNPTVREIDPLLRALSLLRDYRCEKAGAAFQRLADGGHLMHQLHQGRNDLTCRARCMVTFLEQRPGAEKPQNVGNSEAGYNILTNALNENDAALVGKVLEILEADGRLDLLFRIVDARKKYDPFVVQCLRMQADGETPEVFYTPAVVIQRWLDLKNNLNEDKNPERFHKLIGHLSDKTSLIEAIQIADEGFRYEDAGLYLDIRRHSSDSSFQEWCRNGLETLNTAIWKDQLKSEGEVIQLMLSLGRAGMKVALKQPYQDALVEHAKGILAGNIKPFDSLVSQRTLLIGNLGTGSGRTMFRRRLRDAAIDRDGKCGESFFRIYGEELAEEEILIESGNTVARFFSALVRERQIGGLRWLDNMLSNNPNLLDRYSDTASVQDFRERLQGEVDQLTDGGEAQILINSIAKTLGINPKPEPLEESIESEADTSKS